MSQMSFSDSEYAGKRKQTRRERFLAEMEQVVPWSGLVALIEPHYPRPAVVASRTHWKPCCVFTCCKTGSR